LYYSFTKISLIRLEVNNKQTASK